MTSEGVGTELRQLLPGWIVSRKKSCGCESAAEKLDRYGVAWCEQNIDHIVQYLVDQSDKLIPVLQAVPKTGRRVAAERLVRKAIKNAKA